jgi:hypothetical protein
MRLPEPRGPIGELLAEQLPDPDGVLPPPPASDDPLADHDLALALFVCHELHYGGVDGVTDAWEWDPSLVAFRSALEEAMLAQLVELVGPPVPIEPRAVPEAIFGLVADDDAPPLSRYVQTSATLEQFKELVIHRSAYQLKEADPHTFAIPRIPGPAKAAMVEVQADEYGGGDPERMHSRLFAGTMEALGLDTSFGAYVGDLPASTLATVNLISLFGLRRRWRGALVGHLAGFEITSPQPNRRYANGLRRLGLGREATEFYDEHVEADSVHENIAAYDLAGGLARQEPALAGDILFGVRCLLLTEVRFAGHILDAWRLGRSSLYGAPRRAPAAAISA